MPDKITLQVARYRPEQETEPTYQEYEVPCHPEWVVLDGLNYIKDRIDEHRVPGQWLLTGSQTFSLMEGVSQTMSGRVAVLTLDPLSVAEARKDSKIGTFDALLRKVFRPAATKARFEKTA